MSIPDHLVALRDEALMTSCESWAKRQGWKLIVTGAYRTGPCPECGGTDRFWIHAQNDRFRCRQCELAGEGVVKLVMLTRKVGFTQACEIVAGRSADGPFDAEKAAKIRRQNELQQAERDADEERRRLKARREGYDIWRSRSRDPRRPAVLEYLRIRGLMTSDLMAVFDQIQLGEHEALPLMISTSDGWVELARTVAMLAPIQRPDDHFGAVHRTWLDLSSDKGRLVVSHPATGKPVDTKKAWGSKQTGAIRLYTPDRPRRIVMGEGIETTLTPLAHNFEPDTAYWAGVDVGNMTGRPAYGENGKAIQDQPDLTDLNCWQPPDWCEELIFLGETEKAARNTNAKLTRGLLRCQILRNEARKTNPSLPPLETSFVEPPEGGGDLNDLVRT